MVRALRTVPIVAPTRTVPTMLRTLPKLPKLPIQGDRWSAAPC